MQTVLPKEKKELKDKVYKFTKDFFKEPKSISLKDYWQSLYKKSYISKDNSFINNILLVEGACKACPGIGLFLLTQLACIYSLEGSENKDLNDKYLAKLISGEIISCFSLTEKSAGSDVSKLETTAKEEGDSWIINGNKIWSSNGSIADMFFIFAQTKEIGDRKGITCFIAEKENVGIEIHPDTPKIGVKITPSNELDFTNLKVSKANQLGEIGSGVKIALNTITHGRIFCAAQAVGLLSGVLEEATTHSSKRNQFGKSISDFQSIQWYLADMSKDLDAARLLLYKAAWAKDNNSDELNKLSSMAKYFATDVASKHANKGVQILGGQGLIEPSFIGTAYNDAKVLEIYEGTNEIQKVVLSKELNLY